MFIIIYVYLIKVYCNDGVSVLSGRITTKKLLMLNMTGFLSVTFFTARFTPNPVIRASFWSIMIGGVLSPMGFVVSQPSVQRYTSMRSSREALM